MQNKEIKILAALAIAGTILPLSQFIPWLMLHGPDVPAFFAELFSTRIGGFFGMDVIVSAATLSYASYAERHALPGRLWWAPIVCTVCVGVSLGLPVFMILRHLGRQAPLEHST